MPRAIFQTRNGLTVAVARLGERSGVAGSVRQEVHDGDTVTVRTDGNFGVRLLGADAPEISFTLPGESDFTGLGHVRWEEFLSDPFEARFGAFKPPLNEALVTELRARTGPETATNHYRHAQAAEDRLEQEVLADLTALDKTQDTFRFFLAFAQDVIDRYGRFLCYINRDQLTGKRPKTYNERLLEAGVITPYFIWPNTQPFMKQPTLVDAVIPPRDARKVGARGALGAARRSVAKARAAEVGVFERDGPLRLLPFELRFLARRQPPDRWVIDLSAEDDKLIPPQEYFRVNNPEDRLFVPDPFVPLFVEAGWRRGGPQAG